MSALRFLVVDDATFTRDLIKRALRDHFPGCVIDDAADAKRGQSLLRSNLPDLILSDWEMPEISGEEFLCWVREQEKSAKTPFIMVTSRGERDFVMKAVQSGVSDYIGKPFTPEEIVTKVSKQLKKIGKMPKAGQRSPVSSGSPFGSADVLTAHRPQAEPAKAPEPPKPAAAGNGGVPTKPKGQAQLIFPGDVDCQCLLFDVTLQKLHGVLKRANHIPQVFEQVVISLVLKEDGAVARLNGYVHSVEAADARLDSDFVKLVIRFIDDDPQKLEHLSRYIAQLQAS